MLPTLPSKFGERETAPARKAPASSVTEAVCFVPLARLRSGVFPDGWERSAPRSFKAPRTAPKAGTKVRRRPTLMRTWGQLPRRTTPSRGPGKTRTAASIPAAARQGSPPFRRPQNAADRAPGLFRRSSGNAKLPPPRKAPTFSAGLPSAALPPSPGMQTAPAVFPPVRASRLSRSAHPAFPGPPRPVFCRLKTKHRKGESRNLLPFGVF